MRPTSPLPSSQLDSNSSSKVSHHLSDNGSSNSKKQKLHHDLSAPQLDTEETKQDLHDQSVAASADEPESHPSSVGGKQKCIIVKTTKSRGKGAGQSSARLRCSYESNSTGTSGSSRAHKRTDLVCSTHHVNLCLDCLPLHAQQHNGDDDSNDSEPNVTETK